MLEIFGASCYKDNDKFHVVIFSRDIGKYHEVRVTNIPVGKLEDIAWIENCIRKSHRKEDDRSELLWAAQVDWETIKENINAREEKRKDDVDP